MELVWGEINFLLLAAVVQRWLFHVTSVAAWIPFFSYEDQCRISSTAVRDTKLKIGHHSAQLLVTPLFTGPLMFSLMDWLAALADGIGVNS